MFDDAGRLVDIRLPDWRALIGRRPRLRDIGLSRLQPALLQRAPRRDDVQLCPAACPRGSLGCLDGTGTPLMDDSGQLVRNSVIVVTYVMAFTSTCDYNSSIG